MTDPNANTSGLRRSASLMFKNVAGERKLRNASERLKKLNDGEESRKLERMMPRSSFRSKISPVKIIHRAPVPSTASTAHADAFNAPIPDDDDLSYTALFRKYGSHIEARKHMEKIWHAKRELMARGFEIEYKDYNEAQDSRVTARNARSHGPLSKDEGGFRVPMQPRVSPVKRQYALSLGSPVLDPKAESPVDSNMDELQTHSAFQTSPIRSNQKDAPDNKMRPPAMDEQLGAYKFDLRLHGDRRKRRRKDRKEHKVKRSRTSLAREWRRNEKANKKARREAFRARKREALIKRGIDPDGVLVKDMNEDDIDALDESYWLRKRKALNMSIDERKCMHQLFNTDNVEAEVNVASKRLRSVSSSIGMSTLQLQMGKPRVRSLVYSANHFHGKSLPVDDVLKMTFNQRQKSARSARGDKSWGGLEKLYFAQAGLTKVPENISDLTRLQVLDIHANNLTELPDSLVQLHHLRLLDVSANRLQKLPACFGELRKLEMLNAMQNRIAYLPDGIHKCKRLKTLLFKSNTVMVMGVFPVPRFQDERVKSWRDDDIWECVDGKWLGKVYKNRRTGTLRRKPPTGAKIVHINLDMRSAKTWTGELTDVPTTIKARDKSLDFNKLKKAGAPMNLLRLALRNSNASEWDVGIDVNGDTYYETCLKDPGEYGQFLNRTYTMPHAMDRVGKLESIEVIDISMNGVRTIPSSIGRGPLQYRLHTLRLEFNRIRDIPNSICKLGQLQTLDLGNNLIESLPENLGNCVNLRSLRLQFNKLKNFPDSIGRCTALEQLWLNNNNLIDLPIYLGRCTALTDIKAHSNSERIRKMFPWEEGTKAVLYDCRRRISLEETGPPPSVELVEMGIHGEVLVPKQRMINMIKDTCNQIARAAENDPDSDLTALRRKKDKKAKHKNKGRKKGEERDMKEKEGEFDHLTINFNWMGLSEIPKEVLMLEKRLRVLRLVGNHFVDLPVQQLEPLRGLLKLNVSANKIQELPDCFGKLRHLEELNVAENNLEIIPPSVMRLRNLRILDAAHNKLGVLHSGVGRMKSLRELNLASNILEDLPKELGAAVALRKIDVSGNCLRSVPEETGNLYRLRKLNLNFNKIKVVPETFGSLSSLKELHLAANRIKSLPKSLGAVVDIEAEYEALAVAPPRRHSSNSMGHTNTNKGPEIEVLNDNSSKPDPNKTSRQKSNIIDGRNSLENQEQDEDEVPDGGGSSFAENFILREYEDWQAWVEEGPKGTKRKKKLKTSRRQRKGDGISPYMLLTGVVSGACKRGDVIWQKKKGFVMHVSDGNNSEGESKHVLSNAQQDVDKPSTTVIDKALSAQGIVVELISSSSLLVRVTSVGGLVSDPCSFEPGLPVRIGEQGAILGEPKTATQHQHMILTLCPQKGNDDDDDDEDDDDHEDGGYVEHLISRLDGSSWLQQANSGAVGKVIKTLCLSNVPSLPDAEDSSPELLAELEASTQASSEVAGNADSQQQKIHQKEENKKEDEEPLSNELPNSSTKLVSCLVLLLSKEAIFNHKHPLIIHTDAVVEDEFEGDGSEDEDEKFKRLHEIAAPLAVQSRVREVVMVGQFDLPRPVSYNDEDDKVKDDDDERDPVERGTLILQSSTLKFAPPSVAVVSILPSVGHDPNLPLDPRTRRLKQQADKAGAALAPEETVSAEENNRGEKASKQQRKSRQDGKKFKRRKTQEQLLAEEEAKKLREIANTAIANSVQVYALVMQGRPVRHKNCYCVEDFGVDDEGVGSSHVEAPSSVFTRPLGKPELVGRVLLIPEPDLWMKMQAHMIHYGGLLGKSLKKGANRLLVKAVGEQKTLELEEKALRALEIAEARAIFLKQAAIENSIQLRTSMIQGSINLAKASQKVGKAIKDRAIEQVTGRYQLDELSEDSDGQNPKDDGQGDNTTVGRGSKGSKAIKISSLGLIEGGLKGMEAAQVLDLMNKELSEYEEAKRLKQEEEALEKKRQRARGGKMSRKQRKLMKKREEERRRSRPMLLKASPLAGSLSILRLTANRLTEIPATFSHFSQLDHVTIDQNPILSPPSDIATMGTMHIRSYFQLRSQRLQQLQQELTERGIKHHADRMSPEAHDIIAKESRGHLTSNDLKSFDTQVDRLVNGQIVAYRYSARRIVKNLVRVAAKRQHWYHQRILRDFLKLLRIVEKESLLHLDSFVRKEPRPWGDVPHGVAGPIMVRCYVVYLPSIFEPHYDNPVSIAKMIAERKKLGYDQTGFKWKQHHVEEAMKEYKGIWRNNLPVVQFEDIEFEDCVPDPDNKIYDKKAKRMVAKVASGGKKRAAVIKRVLFTDDEVNRKKAEDATIKRFSDPKVYRLGLWFETDEGKEKVQARIYEKRTNLREEQAKAQERAEELAELLAKARKSFFAVKKRKEAYEDGKDIKFHRFASPAECQETYAQEQDAEQEAKQRYDDAVKKLDFTRKMVKRKEHEWVEWSEQTFRDYVVGKVRDEIMLRNRKIANIKGWRRPWDGKEGADYESWRTGKGCQWHPKFLDEIKDLPSDEDSSFTCGVHDDEEGKKGEDEEAVWSPLANLKKRDRRSPPLK